MLEDRIRIDSSHFINDEIQYIVDYTLSCFNHNIAQCHPQKVTIETFTRLVDANIISEKLKIDPRDAEVLILAIGKSAQSMIDGITEFFKDSKDLTIVATSPNIHRSKKKYNNKYYLYKGGHPHINFASINAGERTIQMVSESDERLLVICLISGGGSATFESLEPIFSMDDSKRMSQIMLNLGMEDHEINVFRKTMSRVKGGKLANLIDPSPILNLIISDDVGNDITAIASGPTVECDSISIVAAELIRKWDLKQHLPAGLLEKLLVTIQADGIRKTHCRYPSILTDIMLDSTGFLTSLEKILKTGGVDLTVFRSKTLFRKPVARSAEEFINYINELEEMSPGPKCILAGGEVPIKADIGKGGRNQHFALEVLRRMEAVKQNWVFLSIASDGRDYIKGIAGAYVSSDLQTYLDKSEVSIEEYTEKTNSYCFHEKYKTHLKCELGTDINISDVYVYLSV